MSFPCIKCLEEDGCQEISGGIAQCSSCKSITTMSEIAKAFFDLYITK